MCVCVYVCVFSLAECTRRDPKAPFSIATTPRCKGGHYSIPWKAPLTLNQYLIMLSVKQGGIKYHFLVFSMTGLSIGKHSNHYANGHMHICVCARTRVCVCVCVCILCVCVCVSVCICV